MAQVNQQEMRVYGESEFGPFVASRGRSIFHRPDCKWAVFIPLWKRIEFGTHREAVEADKKPCKTCRA